MKKPKWIVVTHGGAGSSKKVLDAVTLAARTGMRMLRKKNSALDAVEEAVVVMEDDPRFNAGTGSVFRIDGTIEMDASLMDSEFHCGAVATIKGVRNPIRVARKVLESPHILLAGSGATEFARRMGFTYHSPVTRRALRRLSRVQGWLRSGRLPKYAHKWKSYSLDTVGAVAMDSRGIFATSSSTGGTSIALPGRVGDTPLIGCGIYAGPCGAVSVTGVGEAIIRQVLSKSVYDKLVAGRSASEACKWGISLYDPSIPMGIIVVNADSGAGASNTGMPVCILAR
ncbi:MAG: isoaspartyl peptidase/L-asparaginase [Planctomycetota bacterium]|nr:isoaspartyl peptidase/L-asparaginase [Planctomycetota bacterium]